MAVDWDRAVDVLGEGGVDRLLDAVNRFVGDDVVFVPFAGTQRMAYFSAADRLLYGGKPYGGKTYLAVGYALQEAHRSLLVRRQGNDLRALLDISRSMVGDEGFSGGDGGGSSRPVYRGRGRVVHYMGLRDDSSISSMQGEAHDYIAVDEAVQIPEGLVRSLFPWLRRSSDTPEDVRLRLMLLTNPPLPGAQCGEWLVDWFPAWLDPDHDNPAEASELRWYLPDGEGGFEECKEGDSVVLFGSEIPAVSHTFIPSSFEDNPYANNDEFLRSLSGLPADVAAVLMTGNFMMARGDDPDGVIKGSDLLVAQSGDVDIDGGELVAVGVDPCGVGSKADEVCVMRLYRFGEGGDERLVFAEPERKRGSEFSDWLGCVEWVKRLVGNDKSVPIGVDMGGGYGDKVLYPLVGSGYRGVGFDGRRRTGGELTGKMGYRFVNQRALGYYRLGQALDNKSDVKLYMPKDRKLFSDLTAVRAVYKSVKGRMAVGMEGKEDIKKRLKRSTDSGDACMICWWVYSRDVADGEMMKGLRDRGVWRGADSGAGRRVLGNELKKKVYFNGRSGRAGGKYVL